MLMSITDGKARIAVGTIRRRREINWRLKDIPRRILLRKNKCPFFRIFIDVKMETMIEPYDDRRDKTRKAYSYKESFFRRPRPDLVGYKMEAMMKTSRVNIWKTASVDASMIFRSE